jgi:hypothetical protein
MSNAFNTKGLTSVFYYTEKQYADNNLIIKKNVLAYAYDTKVLKMGDGVHTFAELKPVVEANLTPEQKAMLEAVNQANGILKIGDDGNIDPTLLPTTGSLRCFFVATYADLLAMDADKKINSLVTVIDASGDETTTSGSAQYIYDKGNTAWVKINEVESLDIDTSVLLKMAEPTFNLDIIPEGTNYKHTTQADVDKIAGCEEGATRTSLEHVVESGAYTFFVPIATTPES